MAGALKPDLRSPEPLPEADLLCGRPSVSAASMSRDTKTLENDGKNNFEYRSPAGGYFTPERIKESHVDLKSSMQVFLGHCIAHL